MSQPDRSAATTERVSIYCEEYPVFEPELDIEGEHEIPTELYERCMRVMREFGVVQKELKEIRDADA